MQIDWKTELKSYRFWLSVASACLLLFQAVGKPLGLDVNEEIYMSFVNAVLGVFVLFGIIAPTSSIPETKDTQQDEEKKQNNDNKGEKC